MFHEWQFFLKEVLYEKESYDKILFSVSEWLQSGIQTSMLLSKVKCSLYP
jgi:hypothetical protein